MSVNGQNLGTIDRADVDALGEVVRLKALGIEIVGEVVVCKRVNIGELGGSFRERGDRDGQVPAECCRASRRETGMTILERVERLGDINVEGPVIGITLAIDLSLDGVECTSNIGCEW